MNFNVYVDKGMHERLRRLARTRRTSRNALIREALARLLEREAAAGWPEAVTRFGGLPGMKAFESARARLRRPPADPLA
jgi:hypothetical protein